MLIVGGFTDDEGNMLVDDGDFGEKTKQALIKFQKMMKITVDGLAGSETWRSLGLTMNPYTDTPSRWMDRLYQLFSDDSNWKNAYAIYGREISENGGGTSGSWADNPNQGTGNPVKVVSPIWQTTDEDFSPAVQSMLLELNFNWYFADSIEKQNEYVQMADKIRENASSGMGAILDSLSKGFSYAADEFSWFLGGSPSANERDEWLEMNQWFQSDLQIKDDQTLRAGMFIAGILMPGPGGETNLFKNGVKSWIKHGTYNELRETLGKEGVKKFIKAARKGIVGAEGENGIKLIAGKGIDEAGQFYKYELEVFGKGSSHYRILGNYDEKTGHIIFEKIINK